jgi:hypothetical protein
MAMAFRNLLFAGAAIVALNGSVAVADDQDAQTRQLNAQQLEKSQATPVPRSQLNTIRQPAPLAQVGADGMPATSAEKARRERTPRDMAPDTGYQTDAREMDERVAQSEKPGDQHMTTPLPPTTGTEANAVTLSQVDQPDKTLVNAPVESKDGRKIGEVAQVKLDANGKASEVVLNDRNGTRLAAGELVFQPDRGVLITQLSPSDLAPARSNEPEGAPPRSTSPTGGPPNSAPEDQGPPDQPPPDMPDTRPGNNGY